MIDRYELIRKTIVYGTLIGLYTVGIGMAIYSHKPHSQQTKPTDERSWCTGTSLNMDKTADTNTNSLEGKVHE